MLIFTSCDYLSNVNIHLPGSPDILICGNCRELFSNLADFIEHRKQYCKLRFTCKCSSFSSQSATSQSESSRMVVRVHARLPDAISFRIQNIDMFFRKFSYFPSIKFVDKKNSICPNPINYPTFVYGNY